MNLIYDPEALSITSATAGNLLTNCTATINPNYRENALRLNFLAQHGIQGSGEICLVTFTALKEGDVQIGIDKVLLYTDGGTEHNANIGKGTLSVGEYTVSLSTPSSPEAWRGFSTTVSLAANSGVAGGSFVVEYDATVLRFLGYNNAATGFAITVNDSYGEGKIKISFAGTQGVTQESLLALRFVSVDNPKGGISTQIGFEQDSVKLYTQNGIQVIPTASGTSFTIMENPNSGMGDVDTDGEINTRDATVLLQYLSGNSGAVEVDTFADVNCDGTIDEADMDYLMKLLAGWTPAQIAGQ
jgi:hypothetical protein